MQGWHIYCQEGIIFIESHGLSCDVSLYVSPEIPGSCSSLHYTQQWGQLSPLAAVEQAGISAGLHHLLLANEGNIWFSISSSACLSEQGGKVGQGKMQARAFMVSHDHYN